MKIINKKIVALYLIALLSIVAYLVFIMINRSHSLNDQETNNNFQDKEQIQKEERDNRDEKSNENRHQVLTSTYDITKKHCDNECESIKNTRKKNYCLEICGLGDNREIGDCQVLAGFEKDYCLRDSAINEHNVKMCDSIVDKGILTQCRNRITEDIIDDIM